MTAAKQAGERPDSAPYRVLVVANDAALAKLVALTLNHGRFVARIVPNASEALSVYRAWKAHLAVVQADLDPRLLDLPRAVKDSRMRLIALTRRGDLRTKLAAFDRGADDILAVPFAPAELVARATALLRRAYRNQVPIMPTVRVGALEIDILERNVRVGGSIVHLTVIEQALLYLLAANAGTVVSRDTILDALWGSDYVSESDVIDRHIRSLRGKLHDRARLPRFIQTVRGSGYRFIPPPRPLGA